MSNSFENEISVKLGTSEIYPSAKIYKRIINGPEDSIDIYFKVLKMDFVR